MIESVYHLKYLHQQYNHHFPKIWIDETMYKNKQKKSHHEMKMTKSPNKHVMEFVVLSVAELLRLWEGSGVYISTKILCAVV